MEIFIQIPFQKQGSDGGILKLAKADFAESIRFIRKEKPVIGKALLVVCGINLFLAAMIIVALPYLITEVLKFRSFTGKQALWFCRGGIGGRGIGRRHLCRYFRK